MEWISVKDRLPDKGDIYLVYAGGQVALGDFESDTQNWNIQPYCNAWYRSKSCVTHWMPLPEPPKAKSWCACMDDEESRTSIHVAIDVSDCVLPLDEFEDRVYRLFERAMTGLKGEKNGWVTDLETGERFKVGDKSLPHPGKLAISGQVRATGLLAQSADAFQFALLRYIHDPVTEEFLNAGVVIYSKEARYLKSLISTRYSRLSDAFQKQVNGEHYRRVVSYIERQLAKMHNRFQQLDLFDEPPAQIEVILHQVLPPDDSSLVFGGYGGGLTADLDAELYRLYERLVEKYMEREDLPSRTEKEVWQVYRKEFDKHNITIHLRPVTIRTPTYWGDDD